MALPKTTQATTEVMGEAVEIKTKLVKTRRLVPKAISDKFSRRKRELYQQLTRQISTATDWAMAAERSGDKTDLDAARKQIRAVEQTFAAYKRA